MTSTDPSASPNRALRREGRGNASDFTTDRRVLLLCALAVPIGVIGAFVSKALLSLIAVITNAAFFLRWSSAAVIPGSSRLGLWIIIVPVLGSMVIGFMARYGSEKIRGHGIPEALEAILLNRSLIKPRDAILKPISSAVSIGTGGPFGAEGPIIMTGGAFGSIVAQLFRLTAAERKTLLVAGAAAGMSAVFATPVAAVLLAVELMLFEWKPRSLIPVTMAAVVALEVRIPLLGAGPIFPVTPHAGLSPSAFGVALVVGIVVGFGSCAMTKMLYGCEDLFSRLPLHWMWWPPIGGLVVGLGGLIDPRVLGVGYATIHQLMSGELIAGSIVSLLLVKAFVWSFALGSGTSGGVLAPLLMIGGSIGALVGTGIGAGDPGLWAMIGMSAMIAGTMNSPLTGMVFVLEATHDINVLPALMTGSVAALCVTVLLLRRSILTEKLDRRGQHVVREYGVDIFELSRVADVMDTNPPFAPASPEIVVTYPDEKLSVAIAKMLASAVERLPVVNSEDPCRVVGYLGHANILAARGRLHKEEELRERGPLFPCKRPQDVR